MSRGRLLALIALVVVTPTSQAETPPDCTSVTEAPPSETGTYVIVGRGWTEVWFETNGVDGLQRQGCVDGTGATRGPDHVTLHIS